MKITGFRLALTCLAFFGVCVFAETVQDIQTLDGEQRNRLQTIIGTGSGITQANLDAATNGVAVSGVSQANLNAATNTVVAAIPATVQVGVTNEMTIPIRLSSSASSQACADQAGYNVQFCPIGDFGGGIGYPLPAKFRFIKEIKFELIASAANQVVAGTNKWITSFRFVTPNAGSLTTEVNHGTVAGVANVWTNYNQAVTKASAGSGLALCIAMTTPTTIDQAIYNNATNAGGFFVIDRLQLLNNSGVAFTNSNGGPFCGYATFTDK